MKKRTEQAAIAASHRALASSILCTVLYWLLVLGAWYAYSRYRSLPLTHPSAIVFTALLVVPFVTKKIHEKWFEKSWRGKVVQMKDIEEIRTSGRTRQLLTHLAITFSTPEGSQKIIFHQGDEYKIADKYYHMDDEVWKLKCINTPSI